jgi:nucleoside-diphosphate-sugar epimerase
MGVVVNDARPPRLAIAGATGFVGSSILEHLKGRCQVRCLTRSLNVMKDRGKEDGVEWVHCDSHSKSSVSEALRDVDVLIYLIHSMVPTSRLSQASFEDLDLLLADNFARGCREQGVKRIIYISGLIPEGEALSRHLSSRHEVETTLGEGGIALTTMRCGLIVGPGGSSLRILINLVRRLPVMFLPSWTLSKTQPIAIKDVLRGLDICLEDQSLIGSFDIGCPEILTYREMMKATAKMMGKRTPLVPVRGISIGLSKRWVATVSGCSMQLVAPLVDSLCHDMVVRQNPLQDRLLEESVSFGEAVKSSMEINGLPKSNPRQVIRSRDDSVIRSERRVRSVQRLHLPPGKTAYWVMEEYLRWLPGLLRYLIECRVEENGRVLFRLRGMNLTLLELQLLRNENEELLVLGITGGVLASVKDEARGRFEFREILGGKYVMAALHDFSPRLPWYLYNFTQAAAHLYVMKSFGKHLKEYSES